MRFRLEICVWQQYDSSVEGTGDVPTGDSFVFGRVVFVVCSLLTFVAPTMADSGSRVVIRQEFVFESAPFPSCHAATIAEVDGGYFGGYIKPANYRENRIDRRKAKYQNGKRQDR